MRKVAEVFLLAENRLLREALIRLLSKRSEVRVVGANSYSPSVHHEILAAHPQIILLDSSGLTFSKSTLISTLRSAIRNLRIVMVDMDSNEENFLGAVRAGIAGYVLKDASASEVAATIGAVATGKAVCPPSLCMTLFRSIMQQAAPSSTTWGSGLGLSRREREIVDLLRQRLSNKEIAARLNLSEQTVKNHVHHALRKAGVTTRFSIVERCESLQICGDTPVGIGHSDGHNGRVVPD
ncbi:MAG TPA: response regulator transcription factor [Candidatus Dormibacteraeota bacterium]|nr:response regulator transcription factor [Candidatus Dormibacteraeota bacterium]